MYPKVEALLACDDIPDEQRAHVVKIKEIITERVKVLVLAANEGWPVGENPNLKCIVNCV
jgi:hypothetical protein